MPVERSSGGYIFPCKSAALNFIEIWNPLVTDVRALFGMKHRIEIAAKDMKTKKVLCMEKIPCISPLRNTLLCLWSELTVGSTIGSGEWLITDLAINDSAMPGSGLSRTVGHTSIILIDRILRPNDTYHLCRLGWVDDSGDRSWYTLHSALCTLYSVLCTVHYSVLCVLCISVYSIICTTVYCSAFGNIVRSDPDRCIVLYFVLYRVIVPLVSVKKSS